MFKANCLNYAWTQISVNENSLEENIDVNENLRLSKFCKYLEKLCANWFIQVLKLKVMLIIVENKVCIYIIFESFRNLCVIVSD